METIEEKAKDYAENAYIVFPQSAVKSAFIAGYKAAQEWISADDELPEKHTQIIARNGNQYAVFKMVIEIHFVFLKRNFTHWRQIEIN